MNLSMTAGRSKKWLVTVSDANGLVSLTGKSLTFRAKARATDADPPVISVSTGSGITHDPDQVTNKGQATILLAPALTAALEVAGGLRLEHQLNLIDGTDEWMVDSGTLSISPAV